MPDRSFGAVSCATAPLPGAEAIERHVMRASQMGLLPLMVEATAAGRKNDLERAHRDVQSAQGFVIQGPPTHQTSLEVTFMDGHRSDRRPAERVLDGRVDAVAGEDTLGKGRQGTERVLQGQAGDHQLGMIETRDEPDRVSPTPGGRAAACESDSEAILSDCIVQSGEERVASFAHVQPPLGCFGTDESVEITRCP